MLHVAWYDEPVTLATLIGNFTHVHCHLTLKKNQEFCLGMTMRSVNATGGGGNAKWVKPFPSNLLRNQTPINSFVVVGLIHGN